MIARVHRPNQRRAIPAPCRLSGLRACAVVAQPRRRQRAGSHIPRRCLTHQQRARVEVLDGVVLVVRTAAKLDVVFRRAASVRERNDVVEFQQSRFVAAPLAPCKGAASLVAPPDGSAHRCRNVTAPRTARCERARCTRRSDLRAFESFEQERQRAIEDRRGIAVRERVPEEILRAPQLVMRLPAHGELHFVALWRERPKYRDRWADWDGDRAWSRNRGGLPSISGQTRGRRVRLALDHWKRLALPRGRRRVDRRSGG